MMVALAATIIKAHIHLAPCRAGLTARNYQEALRPHEQPRLRALFHQPRGILVTEPLSYNKYLRVPELIGLQECLSDPAHHDELLFITVHQAYELWFKQVLHEIDAALSAMREDRAAAAARSLSRVVEIEKLLVTQIHILETMTPINFLGFRAQLNPASGFQSMQFREVEFASGLKDEAVLRAFRDDEFASGRLRARAQAPTLGEEFYALLSRRGLDAPPDDASASEEEIGRASCGEEGKSRGA